MGVDLPKKSATSPSESSAGRKRKRNSVTTSSGSQVLSGNSASGSPLSSASAPTSNGNMNGAGHNSSGDVIGSSSIIITTIIQSVADVSDLTEAVVRKVAERMKAERKEVTSETLLDEIDRAKSTSQLPIGTNGSETQDPSYTSLPTTLETSSRVSSFPSLPTPMSSERSSSPRNPQRPSTFSPSASSTSRTPRRQGNTTSNDEDVVDGSPKSPVPRSYTDDNDIEPDSCQERSYVDGVAPSCMASSHSEEPQRMPETSSLSTSRPTAGTSSRPTASTSQRKSSSVSSTSLSSASSQHKLSSAQSEKSDEEQTKVQWADSTHLSKSELSKSAKAEKPNEDATAYKSLDYVTSDDDSTHSSKDDTSSKSSDTTKEAKIVHQLLNLVQKEHELLSRNRQCIECSNKQREVTFLPCGHFTTCSACAEPIFTCRLCKKRILGTVTTYLS